MRPFLSKNPRRLAPLRGPPRKAPENPNGRPSLTRSANQFFAITWYGVKWEHVSDQYVCVCEESPSTCFGYVKYAKKMAGMAGMKPNPPSPHLHTAVPAIHNLRPRGGRKLALQNGKVEGSEVGKNTALFLEAGVKSPLYVALCPDPPAREEREERRKDERQRGEREREEREMREMRKR